MKQNLNVTISYFNIYYSVLTFILLIGLVLYIMSSFISNKKEIDDSLLSDASDSVMVEEKKLDTKIAADSDNGNNTVPTIVPLYAVDEEEVDLESSLFALETTYLENCLNTIATCLKQYPPMEQKQTRLGFSKPIKINGRVTNIRIEYIRCVH
jgi:hypothetical protein